MSSIKHIAFDLGNVLVDIDNSQPIIKLMQFGLTQQQAEQAIDRDNLVIVQYETGKISTEEFCQAMTADSSIAISPEQFATTSPKFISSAIFLYLSSS